MLGITETEFTLLIFNPPASSPWVSTYVLSLSDFSDDPPTSVEI